MPELTPQAMVSSAANLSAERFIVEEELKRAFEKVVLAPEHTAAGTPTLRYIQQVKQTDFLVVILTQVSRPAVQEEIAVALKAHTHIAAFALHYPPHLETNAAWQPTPEEIEIRESGVWIKDVSSILDLRLEVM
ncbi:MAG TPA: hypothetical protein VGK53_16835, partial [Propionicimonas sp.]